MRNLLLVLMLLFSSVGFTANPIIAKAHKTAHQITALPIDGKGGWCSATAIGPHALLTASHCNAIATKVSVDGKPVEILSIVSDGLDHSIYLLGDGVAFTDYATVKLGNSQEQGDDIFVFGNPGSYSDMLRKGYVAGFDKDKDENDGPTLKDIVNILKGKQPDTKPPQKKHMIVLYDFNGFFGDSGAAIFDDAGNIIAVTSFITANATPPYQMKYMASYELRLTKEQLDQARTFQPPKVAKD
jgi:hypothetical protein